MPQVGPKRPMAIANSVLATGSQQQNGWPKALHFSGPGLVWWKFIRSLEKMG